MASEYKDTLIMPQTAMEMKANLPQKEPQIQAFWKDHEIYQKLLKKNSHNPQFTLHDGPPYANGNIHIGHALNKTLKDIIVRYKSMCGFSTHFIPGWDTHGLPIENAIAKIDNNFEKGDLSAIEKRRQCKEYALQQVATQQTQFASIGLLTDFKEKYLTLDTTFETHELNLFKEMVKQKIVYQDYKPVYWSWSSVSSLADAEIEYADVKSPSIYIAFKVCDSQKLWGLEDVNLIIWTTTPWTIPANLAIAVNPHFEYVIFKANDKFYLVAEDLLKSVSEALGFGDVEVVKKVKGTSLELVKYIHPLNQHINPVILAEYVTNDSGTGLVHNAPGFGLDDYYACKKYHIDVYCPIDDYGCYDKTINDKELEGMFYLDANKVIGQRLEACGALLALKFITHSAAHDWRTKKPVMYRATKQWFVNIKALHPQILKTLSNDVTSSVPKTIERIKEMVLNRDEWCISRQRVWGVPIPIIFDANKEPLFDLELIEHIITILSQEGTDTWFIKDAEYFLTDKYLATGQKYTKEKDILDVWFDSGSSFGVLKQHHLNFPADLYLEGSDQFRGWFNSSLICATILNNQAPYKYLLQHGFTLDEKGNKMSKSLGNTISPLDVFKEYGADIFRTWVATSDYSIDTRFGFNILKQTSETYRKIRNTLFRYTLSNLHDFDVKLHWQTSLALEDNYILHCLNENLKRISYAYDNYKFIDVIKTINNFTIELSQWYFDIIKDALYCEETNAIRRRQIQTVLYQILDTLLIALTPIMPHTCEEVYQLFNKTNKCESIALETFIKEVPTHIDASTINAFNSFFNLKDTIYCELENMRNQGILKKNNEATIIIPSAMLADIPFSEKQIQLYLNVAKVIKDDNSQQLQIKNEGLKKCCRCWNHFDNKDMASDDLCHRCHQVIHH